MSVSFFRKDSLPCDGERTVVDCLKLIIFTFVLPRTDPPSFSCYSVLRFSYHPGVDQYSGILRLASIHGSGVHADGHIQGTNCRAEEVHKKEVRDHLEYEEGDESSR